MSTVKPTIFALLALKIATLALMAPANALCVPLITIFLPIRLAKQLAPRTNTAKMTIHALRAHQTVMLVLILQVRAQIVKLATVFLPMKPVLLVAQPRNTEKMIIHALHAHRIARPARTALGHVHDV